MRKAIITVVLMLVAAAALLGGPGGWYARAARTATALEHRAYVAAAWPPLNVGLYVGAYITAHNRASGGFYSIPKAGTQAQVRPHLVGWDAWMRDPEARWAQLHTKQESLLRLAVLGEIGGVAILLVLLLAQPLWYLTTGMAKLRPSTSLGSARLATWRDLRGLRATRRDAQIILGRLDRRIVALRGLEQYQSTLVVGPPRAGKSVSLFVTNLLAERGQAPGRRRTKGVRSVVVTDLKGELTERTYAALSRHHRCLVVNFVSPRASAGYNPLAHIKSALDAQVFAQTWIANTGESTEPFWDSAAKYLITALVLHLGDTQPGGATLTHLRKFLSLGSATIMIALADSPNCDVKEAMDGFMGDLARNEKLQGSIFVELPLRFQVLADERVQATTGHDEVDFAAMAARDERPVALYLVLDRRMSRELKPLTACFFTQMFNELIEVADRSPGGVLPRPVLGYLDEMGNLGQIYNFPTWMTTVRSAGMGFLLAVQSLAQLEELYGAKGKEIIVGACNVKIALAKTAAEDAKWFSEQSGTATVLAANAGASRKRGAVLVDHGNQGYSETAQPLLTPGEVTRMADNRLLMLSGNRPPAILRQVRWYERRYRVFPTRLRRLGHLRLPDGVVVPPAGPPRRWPLVPPTVAFDVTIPRPVASAGDGEIPHRPVKAAESERAAAPLEAQLEAVMRKRRERAEAAATMAQETTGLDEETHDEVPVQGWA